MAEMQVPVTKAKGTRAIDTEKVPEAVYAEALLLGLKELMNRGMSKITATSHPDEEARKAAAMEQAEKNYDAIMTGKIRFSGKKAKGASGAVMVEARRIAKAMVKDALKSAGIKISHVPAKEITAAANALIAEDPSIVETAKAALEARAAAPIAIDVTKLVHADPALVAKAESKKTSAKAAGQLSAKQAGKAAPRKQKPGAQPAPATQ